MSTSSGFVDEHSARRHPLEQEGFAAAVGLAAGEFPICGSSDTYAPIILADFRGPLSAPDGAPWGQGSLPPILGRRSVEWETSPAASSDATVFTWVGGSQVRPFRPAYPYATARLSVDGAHRLSFPLGWPNGYIVRVDGGFVLTFEPRRMISLTESAHRVLEPHGVSGFYRLEVPGGHLRAGRALRLRVEIDPPPDGAQSLFFISPRADALSLSLATLRDELAQLQSDVVRLTRSHEMLYAQNYPGLFPARLRNAERVIAWQHELNHYHPATITVLRSGDSVITAREADDHLDPKGRIVILRSRDGGRTWSPPRVLFDRGNVDHRCSPIFELPNGDWVTTDYQAGSFYRADGAYTPATAHGPSLWGAWSTDEGQTWQFSDRPITVPGQHPYGEAERHMVRLPSGRLLVAANYTTYGADGKTPDWTWAGMAVHLSEDDGRTWRFLARVPEDSRVIGEPTLVRTKSGRLVLLARSEVLPKKDFTARGMLLQSVSTDDGATWSAPEPTGMSSQSAPAHLIQLQDGRLLVSHASRSHPGSIYVTTSSDEGRTWDTGRTRIVTDDLPNEDSTYPTSGQLPDGTILTTWYGNLFGKFYIAVARYRPEEL